MQDQTVQEVNYASKYKIFLAIELANTCVTNFYASHWLMLEEHCENVSQTSNIKIQQNEQRMK